MDSELERQRDAFSDIYKDWCGFRPASWMYDALNAEELKREISDYEWLIAQQTRYAEDTWRLRIQSYLDHGADTMRSAIRWDMDTYDLKIDDAQDVMYYFDHIDANAAMIQDIEIACGYDVKAAYDYRLYGSY